VPDPRTRVAIACQGGGSHTAFTAGVLKRLLGDPGLAERVDVAGLSGTSGGAVCALLAWSALREHAPERAGDRLDAFWDDVAATTPAEWALNAWVLGAGAIQDVVATPAISPYDAPWTDAAMETFKRTLERQVDFGALAPPPGDAAPLLLIGAVDVLSGAFKAFDSRRDEITADTVLASAAIPTLFRAVHVDDGTYWDGLFSQNPPVRELTDARPDEIWVIQINPTEAAAEPRTVMEIADRRNELAGNLSLNQELQFIEKIDQLLETGELDPDGRYRRIVVRVLELSRTRFSRSLGTASKLNRDPAFLRDLMAHGEARAEEFLVALAFEDAWVRRDHEAVAAFFAADAELVAAAPFPAPGCYRGRDAIGAYVRDHFTDELAMDLTRKQVAGAGVTWSVRVRGAEPAQGLAEAAFDGGRVTSLRLTAPP
jgi:NTE family protein